MDPRTKAILSHVWIIGWILAYIAYNTEKDEFSGFYIRQQLGFNVLALAIWIPVLGPVIGLILFVFWLMSLISAIQGEMQITPFIGQYFQEIFKGL